MIDWHSHILPKMDDGSNDVTESIKLLKMLAEQGVDIVAATPHFNADAEPAEQFLNRRDASYQLLSSQLPECVPKIILGAEVKYYSGIGKMHALKQLRIEGTKLLLLEMPVSKWTEYTVRELVEIAGIGDLTVMLAHMERYLPFQSASVWELLYRKNILMQVNASFFADFRTRHKAFSLLSKGRIHFIGSDCHSVDLRPPKINNAYSIIEKRYGNDFIRQMNEFSYSMFANNKMYENYVFANN